MRLRDSKTGWFIVSPSPSESEKRHVYDLAFTVLCLEAAGIPPADIEVFIDGSEKGTHQLILSDASSIQRMIHTSSELALRIQQSSRFENLVIVFTGHGSPDGIVASNSIKPAWLVTTLKSAVHLKYSVLVFCQCYAGVFNYVNAKPDSGKMQPELVIIGSASFSESLSAPIRIQFLRGERSWSANTFLLWLSNWFRDPIDIDGDNKVTLMDAFKFAAVGSRQLVDNARASVFQDLLETHAELRSVTQTLQAAISGKNPTIPPPLVVSTSPQIELEMRKQVLEKDFHEQNKLQLLHPEPWILNAWLAQEICF